MAAKIIDGEAIAAGIAEELKKEVAALAGPVKLVAVIATENKGARIYAGSQEKTCAEVGIQYELAELAADSDEAAVVARIEELNADAAVTGIIIQMPLPEGVDAKRLQRMIAPAKDVEGMNPANQGMVTYAAQPFFKKPKEGEDGFDNWLGASLGWPLPSPAPCTPVGAVTLLRSLGIDLYGKEAVVIGHSEIVGKPIALLLMAHFCTTTVCHIATQDLASHVKAADIVVAAAGVPGLIKGEWIKEGAIVIDVGINRVKMFDENGEPVFDKKGKQKMQTVGDVEFDAAAGRAGYITPVPGGVGPMTVVMLLKNTVDAAKRAG
ncbi:MAG: bifunctional 5,10-methylenetetrahydrofolate dehydrogenase/5,10-methenyltetrahydrofolate cyclohydrolase [Planctomycetota bacterium]